ncbi:hypothetical protein ACFU6I_11680 [Streptomyces sp. NPDC057486]|uniref:hypothetical protein n=1 Tax=Streptomyces sp. NPDC057486 TaxID=3346145 RepID=UPI0036A6C5A4
MLRHIPVVSCRYGLDRRTDLREQFQEQGAPFCVREGAGVADRQVGVLHQVGGDDVHDGVRLGAVGLLAQAEQEGDAEQAGAVGREAGCGEGGEVVASHRR